MVNYNKSNELSSFIHNNGLIDDDKKVTQFMAQIKIATASNSIENIELKVSATLDESKDFGQINFSGE
jgi:hypothetical protein